MEKNNSFNRFMCRLDVAKERVTKDTQNKIQIKNRA